MSPNVRSNNANTTAHASAEATNTNASSGSRPHASDEAALRMQIEAIEAQLRAQDATVVLLQQQLSETADAALREKAQLLEQVALLRTALAEAQAEARQLQQAHIAQAGQRDAELAELRARIETLVIDARQLQALHDATVRTHQLAFEDVQARAAEAQAAAERARTELGGTHEAFAAQAEELRAEQQRLVAEMQHKDNAHAQTVAAMQEAALGLAQQLQAAQAQLERAVAEIEGRRGELVLHEQQSQKFHREVEAERETFAAVVAKHTAEFVAQQATIEALQAQLVQMGQAALEMKQNCEVTQRTAEAEQRALADTLAVVQLELSFARKEQAETIALATQRDAEQLEGIARLTAEVEQLKDTAVQMNLDRDMLQRNLDTVQAALVAEREAHQAAIATSALLLEEQERTARRWKLMAVRPARLVRRSVATGRPNGRVARWAPSAQRSAERQRMVLGKGQRLRGFVSQPIETEAGVRFDIPLQEGGARRRRIVSRGAAVSGRPAGRVPRWRGNAKYDAQRRLMAAGAGQRLAGLRAHRFQTPAGVRFDIPLSDAAATQQQQRAFQQVQSFQPQPFFQAPQPMQQQFQAAPPAGQIISKDRQAKYTVITQGTALPPMLSQPVVAPHAVGGIAAPPSTGKHSKHSKKLAAHPHDAHSTTTTIAG